MKEESLHLDSRRILAGWIVLHIILIPAVLCDKLFKLVDYSCNKNTFIAFIHSGGNK